MLRRGTCSAPNLRVSSVFFHLLLSPLPSPLSRHLSLSLSIDLSSLRSRPWSLLISLEINRESRRSRKVKRSHRVPHLAATERTSDETNVFLSTSLVTNWRALLLSYVVFAFSLPLPLPLPLASRFAPSPLQGAAKVRVTKRYDARTSEHTIMVGYRLFFWHSDYASIYC